MVSVYMDGEDKTSKITDWKLWYCQQRQELQLTCIFPSGKSYRRPMSVCRINPVRSLEGVLITQSGSALFKIADKVILYAEKYAVIYYPGKTKPYVQKSAGLLFLPSTGLKHNRVFQYFEAVAEARVTCAETASGRLIAENVKKQLQKLLPNADTALQAYCTSQNQRREAPAQLIYPFGINLSQLAAVEQAFSSQISLIEGPPGTGKTQTILNILANILLQKKTVAILSNNNAAVENLYEKLDKAGLGYLIARLGSSDNKVAFFAGGANSRREKPAITPDLRDIDSLQQQLKQHLDAYNQIALLQAELGELTTELNYLRQWYAEHRHDAVLPLDKYNLSPKKITDFMAYLSYLRGRPVRLRDRVELLLNFRILRTGPFAQWNQRTSLIYALQLHFYEKSIQEKSDTLAGHKEVLSRHHFDALLNQLTSSSMAYLKSHLYQHIDVQQQFDCNSYKANFDAFVKRYPIIGSSTHSIVNSVAPNALLDYVIIDEASQQDIVPGILGLGCARNLIIVGDRKQLPHVPVKTAIEAPAEFYNCAKYSLLDSCIGLFHSRLPTTLLKEHYRCHPKIIQFCNKQFYDNQLIPMKQDQGEQALSMVITAKGNHTRNFSNLRELESLSALEWDEQSSRGFIAPYNAQINLSKTQLADHFVKSTVHKFQGRECDEIVFSTVLDKKASSQKNLDFVDDPYLVNVAVSRAKNKFTLVTGADVFAENNSHIAALIRYIDYYADEGQIQHSPVISAFDLLYSDYDRSLEKLNQRLKPEDSDYKSEQIAASLLRDLLSQDSYSAITFHSQIALIQLVSVAGNNFTAREKEFMRNRASCDFVLYFKIGKKPLGVIEIDSGFHDSPQQTERDQLKNSILQKAGIPLLRFRTTESNFGGKVAAFLAQWRA
jgi:RecA/RadA recombinase